MTLFLNCVFWRNFWEFMFAFCNANVYFSFTIFLSGSVNKGQRKWTLLFSIHYLLCATLQDFNDMYNLPLKLGKKREKKEQRPHLLWHNKIVELSLTIFHEKNTVRNIFQIQPKCIAAEWPSSPFSKIDLVKPKKG